MSKIQKLRLKSSPKSSPFLPVRTVIARITKLQPTTVADFRTTGIKLRYIDEGVFRKVYKISGCPLVVKFPLDNDGIQHSVSEMRRIRRLGRIKELLPHLPKVLYFNGKSGIVVMEYYKALDPEKGVELLGKVIKKLVSRIAKVAMSDIHSDNIRQGRRGEIVVFSDLGY